MREEKKLWKEGTTHIAKCNKFQQLFFPQQSRILLVFSLMFAVLCLFTAQQKKIPMKNVINDIFFKRRENKIKWIGANMKLILFTSHVCLQFIKNEFLKRMEKWLDVEKLKNHWQSEIEKIKNWMEKFNESEKLHEFKYFTFLLMQFFSGIWLICDGGSICSGELFKLLLDARRVPALC